MSDTRSEFRGIVGLGVLPDDVGLNPSEAIRAMWVQHADTYDTGLLAPIWRYQIHVAHDYASVIGRPVAVMRAFWDVMVSVCAYNRSSAPSAFPGMQAYIDALGAGTWLHVQDAIERLIEAWQDIKL